MNLYEFFKKNGRWDPSRVFLEDLRTGKSFHYSHLDEESARFARRLLDLGVQPGDRVAAQVEKSPEAVFLYLGCLRAGAVYLPLNTAYPAAEVDYFLRDAKPKLFICDPSKKAELLETAESAGAILLTLDDLGQGTLISSHGDPGDFDRTEAGFATFKSQDSDLAALLYTSGTTGRSKGAMLSHRNLAANAWSLSRAWGFTREDRLLHALPIFHVHGLFISLHCTLISGSSLLWLPKYDAGDVIRHLPRSTVFMGVPTYYTRLLDKRELIRSATDQVRLFVSGSAPLLAQTFEEFESRTGKRILERYGMTETGVIASNPLAGERIPGWVGLPLDGVSVRVAPSDGVIEVKGENVFSGYWRQEERNHAEFTADGYFRTGDLGELDSSGYLRIVGRAKDLVISGGFNIYPKEVELILDGMQEVLESAVFGVPHPDFGEAVVAAVVLRRDHEISAEELMSRVRGRLASFKAPKKLFFLPQLPRNIMGKVQKNMLRAQFKDRF